MPLERFVVYIDETMYERVFLDPEKVKIGQKYKLPEQDNPNAKEFIDKELIVSNIERGCGGNLTAIYHFRTD